MAESKKKKVVLRPPAPAPNKSKYLDGAAQLKIEPEGRDEMRRRPGNDKGPSLGLATRRADAARPSEPVAGAANASRDKKVVLRPPAPAPNKSKYLDGVEKLKIEPEGRDRDKNPGLGLAVRRSKDRVLPEQSAAPLMSQEAVSSILASAAQGAEGEALPDAVPDDAHQGADVVAERRAAHPELFTGPQGGADGPAGLVGRFPELYDGGAGDEGAAPQLDDGGLDR